MFADYQAKVVVLVLCIIYHMHEVAGAVSRGSNFVHSRSRQEKRKRDEIWLDAEKSITPAVDCCVVDCCCLYRWSQPLHRQYIL
jgi:hypothetical protein